MRHRLAAILGALCCWQVSGAAAAQALAVQGAAARGAAVFVRAPQIVFADDFRRDSEGTVPGGWKVINGEGLVRKMGGELAFALTLPEGGYAQAAPLLTSPLADSFTIEVDFYLEMGGSEAFSVFLKAEEDDEGQVNFGRQVWTAYLGNDISAPYPDWGNQDFTNRWHHAALAYDRGRITCWLDQHLILVVPSTGKVKRRFVGFGGLADPEHPALFKNVRIAIDGARH